MFKTINLILLVSLIGLTGCFEIREEVDLNNDGSGKLMLTINLSESSSNLSNYMKMNEVQGIQVPTEEEIRREIRRIVQALSKSEGISNVEYSENFRDFIFIISSDFDDIQNLNLAINGVADALNRTPFETIKLDNFDYTDRSFRRYFNYPVSLLDFNQLPSMQRYMLETARMVSVYRFQKPIRTFTNEQAELSPSKRSIKLEQSLGSIIKGDVTIANSVIF